MNPTRLLTLASIATLVTLAACGGDDDSGSSPTGAASGSPGTEASGSPTVSDDAYFESLTSALDDIAVDSQALDDFRVGAFDESLTEEERIANADEFAQRYEAFAQDAHDRVLDITPGESLSGEHGALVDALGDLISLGHDLATALQETPVSTDQQFGDLFFALDGQSLELRVRDACFRLQQVATDVGIEAAIICPR